MKRKLIRGFILILILPIIAIIFSPSSRVAAQVPPCAAPGTQTIEVVNGLISAIDVSSFKVNAGANVSCIDSKSALIPQIAISSYNEMKTLYYDQAICTGCKTKLTDNQIQYTENDIINLSEIYVHPTPPVVDNSTSKSGGTNVSILTWSHTVGAGNNRLLMVFISTRALTGHDVASVTYDNTPLTRLGIGQAGAGDLPRVETWYLLNPPTGINDVKVTLYAPDYPSAGAISFTGVNQTAPFDTWSSSSGTSTTASLTVTSGTNELVADVLSFWNNTANATSNAGQTLRWSATADNAWKGAGSIKTGTTSTAMGWTLPTSTNWAIGGVSIKPVSTSVNPWHNDKLYWVDGNLTLELESNITVNNTGVIFVDGDLFINSNQTNNISTTGLVFIVQGKIYVKPEVTEINAFMISFGGFCSAYQPSLYPDNCQDLTDTTQQQLVINGSVISLSRTETPQFVRQKTTPTTAAETINYQPKYLVILKDIFARDLKIWQEVQ